MGQKIYLVRHCKAEGQPPESQLTEEGFQQAEELAKFFSNHKVDRIISSPFTRAQQSIEPTAKMMNLPVEIDDRLSERILSTENHEDWLEKLQYSFDDMEVKLAGGESSQEALDRAVKVIEDIKNRTEENVILVTHGNLMALLLKSFDHTYGFDEWKKLSNPDVFVVELMDEGHSIERTWKAT